jgi:ABC-type nitrate/sulfonate/bicarbonate transport system substrate-binding protein
MTTPLRMGFIPLVGAAAQIVAVDKGSAAAEGLDVTLVREVSWSNVRDKLNIGLFDAAHLLAPWCNRRPPWWTASPAVTSTRLRRCALELDRRS